MTRILVVEDNEDLRVMLRRQLTRQGYEACEAADGDQATALARELRPDLILMDMGLPGRDGWQVSRELKSRPATAAIPIIALTAHAMAGDREQALRAGCDDYVTKPIDFPQLWERIGRLLKAGRGGGR